MPEVTITLKTIDDSTAKTKKVKEEFKSLVPALENAGKGIANFVSANAVLIGSVAAVGAAAAKAYGDFQKYAGDVRDLSIASGTTATEASTLLQVLDDYQLTAGDVTAASRAMKEKGLVPTLETLAQLSDQFKAIQDPAERLKFAQDNLGRSAANYYNVLSQGGDVLRKNAEEVNKNLVLTDEQIKKAEMARLAVDAWSDSWEGFKVSMGAAVGEWIVANTVMKDSEKAYKEWARLNGVSVEQLEQTRWNISETTSEYQLFSAEYEKNAALTEYWTGKLGENSVALEENTVDVKALSESLSGQISLIDSMQSAEERFTSQSTDLTKQRAEAEAKLAELRRQGYWEQSAQVQDQIGKIEEIKTKEKELADERAKQSLQFVSNILQEQLARDGWTQSEFDAFAAQQEAWGLWSSDVVAKSKAAWMEAQKITDAINNIPSEKNISVNFNVSGYAGVANYDERVANATKKQHASGGMFQIPMSYGNEGFRLGNGDTASGGEGLAIIPKDQMNGQQGGGNAELLAAIRGLPRQIVSAMQQTEV